MTEQQPVNNGEPILGRNPKLIQISNSEISNFKGCRRKWWLENYRGLRAKQKKLVGPLPLGTRVHNALELYYTDGSDPVEEYMRLLEVDELLFQATIDANDDVKVKKFNDEAELGRLMVEGYIEWVHETNADAGLEIVGAEQIIRYRLKEFEGRVELMGKLDLVVRRKSDGSLALMDHKTAATFDPYHKYYMMSEQLMMYTMLHLLQPDRNGQLIDGGIYNLLKKVKRSSRATPPFYKRIDVRFNRRTIQAFWMRTLGTLRDMISTRQALDDGVDHHIVAYPTPSNDCSWKCPFYLACPLFDDGSAVEEMLAAGYEQIDPYERYSEESK